MVKEMGLLGPEGSHERITAAVVAVYDVTYIPSVVNLNQHVESDQSPIPFVTPAVRRLRQSEEGSDCGSHSAPHCHISPSDGAVL